MSSAWALLLSTGLLVAVVGGEGVPSHRGSLRGTPAASFSEREQQASHDQRPCADHAWDCIQWAQQGKCETDSAYMMQTCYKACSKCTPAPSDCEDHDWDCIQWAEGGRCESESALMAQKCRKACGLCTEKPAGSSPESLVELGEAAEAPSTADASQAKKEEQGQQMQFVAQEQRPCADHAWDCIQWAQQGKCETDSAYMMQTCYKACSKCTPAPSDCEDHDWDCIQWAEGGRCESESALMAQKCRKACGLCES